jgi:prepilin-type N-terminal cleavage/methylation domain-containing protein
MIKNRKNRKGFTLIELLVVIAIIAILAVVVVLTLNPAELLRQARDSNRTSDFATLKSAIGLYSADVATTTWLSGSSVINNSSTMFLSTAITATTPTTTPLTANTACGTANPTVAWGFLGGESVVSGTISRAVNGTGWLPLNLTAISSGAPIGSLPVDPVNSGANVYVYVGAQTTYKLATKTESIK